jgi:hypothetical protein
VSSFVCRICKEEITPDKEVEDKMKEQSICWDCYKILRVLFEDKERLQKAMLWYYHSNTIQVDNNTISPLKQNIVLSN